MNLKKILLVLTLCNVIALSAPTLTWAAPHFTLTPVSASKAVGENFTVVMGVDSDTSKVVGIDIKASYDSSKLEIVSIEKGLIPDDGYQFSYTSGQAIIHNDGTFEVTLTPISQSVLTGPIAKHELLKVTFKAKSAGTATFKYICTSGSLTETNIINEAGSDVVDCNVNDSGSYTISGSSSNSETTVTTPTKSVASSSLPKTGGVSDTIAMILVGMSSIGVALYFKYL